MHQAPQASCNPGLRTWCLRVAPSLWLLYVHTCVCVRGGSVSVSLPHSPLVASQELGQLGGGECNVFPDTTLPDPRVSHGVYDPIGVFTYRITPVWGHSHTPVSSFRAWITGSLHFVVSARFLVFLCFTLPLAHAHDVYVVSPGCKRNDWVYLGQGTEHG